MDLKQGYDRFDGALKDLLYACSSVPQNTPAVIILEIGQFLYKGFLEWDSNCSERFKLGVASRRPQDLIIPLRDIVVSQAVINSCVTFTFQISLPAGGGGWSAGWFGICAICGVANLSDENLSGVYLPTDELHWLSTLPAAAIYTIYTDPKNRNNLTLMRDGSVIATHEWPGEDRRLVIGLWDQHAVVEICDVKLPFE